MKKKKTFQYNIYGELIEYNKAFRESYPEKKAKKGVVIKRKNNKTEG